MKQLYAELKTAREAIIIAHAFRRRVMRDIATKRCPLKVGNIYVWMGPAPHQGRLLRCDEIAPSGGWDRDSNGKDISWFAYLTLLKRDFTPMKSGKNFRRILVNEDNAKWVRPIAQAQMNEWRLRHG